MAKKPELKKAEKTVEQMLKDFSMALGVPSTVRKDKDSLKVYSPGSRTGTMAHIARKVGLEVVEVVGDYIRVKV